MERRRHELAALAGVALAGTLVLRGLFLLAAPWLWSFARAVPANELTPWGRSVMGNRDGLEPYALLAAVGLLWLAIDLAMGRLARLAPRARAAAAAVLLAAGAVLARLAPPEPPMAAVSRELPQALLVVAAALAASALLARAMRFRPGIPAAVAVVLLPLCLVPTTLPSLQDASTVLAPALRLAHGFPLPEIYLQYDLMPSLLGLAWTRLGGAPMTFTLVCAGSFYALFLGLFWLARRLFVGAGLAAPLLVSVVIARMYAVILDAHATPQATPLRLDLWVGLLAVAFAAGLRHWAVGLVLGALFFFARSMGTLYIGAYALALVADLLAERRAVDRARRAPLARDLVALARETAPGWAFVALAFLAARLAFGSFGSDAIALYRRLGVGMLRMTAPSFYWWLLPLTGAVGWLAFSRRGPASLSNRRGPAAILAVTLVFVSSIYFFGRSHEHNLVNLATGFLFLTFLGLDLASAAQTDEAAPVRAFLRAAPWLVVAACAYFYSARVADKLATQKAVVAGHRALPPAMPGDFAPVVACAEITQASGDGRVFFFSRNDYWFYERCGFTPEGYVQPLWLTIMEEPVVAELNRLLDDGYKIVVPTQAGDWAEHLAALLPALGQPRLTETANYRVYRRPGAP